MTTNFWSARDMQALRLLEDAVRGYLKSREGLDEADPQERWGVRLQRMVPTAGANPCGPVCGVFTVTSTLHAGCSN